MPLISNLNKSPATYNKRIDLVDVLRGFALFGIVISHAAALSNYAGPLVIGPGETILLGLRQHMVVGKFYPIFSFLFGLSFYFQMQGWKAKNEPFAGRFIWRSLILFIIGCVHASFSHGDILHIYAILSVFLLFVNVISNKWLVVISIMLIFLQPYLRDITDNIFFTPHTNSQILADDGSDADIINDKTELMKMLTSDISNRNFMILGLFFLGVIAGRKNIFTYTTANLKLFTRMLAGSMAVTVILFLAGPPANPDLALFLKTLNRVAVACMYTAGIALLYWRTPFKKILDILCPVGKMGLTNYLMETVFRLGFLYYAGTFIMNTWGWYGGFAYCIAFYLFQVMYSNLWMSRFRYGPMEWLWRSLTYLKLQRIKK